MRRLGSSHGIAVGILAAALTTGLGCRRQQSAAPAAQDAPAQSEPARPAAAEPVTLAAGTALSVRTASTISTESHKSGDTFVAHLTEPLVAGDRVIAAKGARVEGVVARSSKGGRVKGRASIAVRITRLEGVDGGIEIQTNAVGRQARSTKKQDALKVGIGSGVGAAIGAIAGGGRGAAIGAASGAGAGAGYVLATHGAPAVIPSESLLRFRLAGPVTVPAGAQGRQ